MRYAIIKDNIVFNVAEGPPIENDPLGVWVQSDEAEIGFIYDNGVFVNPIDPVQEKIQVYRRDRDTLLKENVDPYVGNLLRWNSLTDQQKNDLTIYRQALLDIPQQPEFPTKVIWPKSPLKPDVPPGVPSP